MSETHQNEANRSNHLVHKMHHVRATRLTLSTWTLTYFKLYSPINLSFAHILRIVKVTHSCLSQIYRKKKVKCSVFALILLQNLKDSRKRRILNYSPDVCCTSIIQLP